MGGGKHTVQEVNSILVGYEPDSQTWENIIIDSDGTLYSKGMVKDAVTLSWVPAIQGVIKTDSLIVSGVMTNPNLDVALSTRLKPADTLAAVTSITNPISTKNPLSPSSPTFATVGVASAQAVAVNASRKGITLVNTSTNIISLGFGSNPAVLNSGLTLMPNGVWNSWEYDFNTLAINAIASGSGSNLSIQEYM